MKASTMLEGLLAVKEAVLSELPKPEWFSSNFGICRNLEGALQIINQEASDHAYRFVSEFSICWSEHSGSRSFPVSEVIGVYSPKWTGEHGAARLRLLDYLIQRVEALGNGEINLGDCE